MKRDESLKASVISRITLVQGSGCFIIHVSFNLAVILVESWASVWWNISASHREQRCWACQIPLRKEKAQISLRHLLRRTHGATLKLTRTNRIWFKRTRSSFTFSLGVYNICFCPAEVKIAPQWRASIKAKNISIYSGPAQHDSTANSHTLRAESDHKSPPSPSPPPEAPTRGALVCTALFCVWSELPR